LKRSRKSYTTNNQIKKGKPSIAIIGSYIKLPKLGKVKAVIHRLPKDDWSLKSVTVSMDVDGCFYASVLFAYDEVIPNHIVNNINAVGLDYKSNGLYVDNNGNTVENHHFFKHSYKKLAKEQRRLSRKKGSKKGEEKSHNYKKQQRKVAKIHEKIANQRKYHLHMESNKIVNCYDVVCVESLNMKWLANKKFGNGKATMDNGYGTFLTLLEYKLHDRGKILVKVDKWYPSSQLCYDCGYKNPLVKDLNVRDWICPHCGSYHDRDVNAAKNILREGLRVLATDCC
jgi:putative transposase